MEWHNQVFLYGECLGCGVENKLSFCLVELASMGFNLVE